MQQHGRSPWLRLVLGIGLCLVLLGVASGHSIADDNAECPEPLEELQKKQQMLRDWINRQTENIQKMKAELTKAKAENRAPDVGKLGNVLATASGARSKEYDQAPPYIKAQIEKVEKNPILSLIGVAGLMGGVSTSIEEGKITTAQAHYSVEIKRTGFLKRFLEGEEKRVLKCIEEKKKKAGTDCPSGAYLVACDPGMGGEPPFISDANQQGFGGGIPPDEPTSGAAGGGEPVEQPGSKPGQTETGGPGTSGQGAPPGYWCYSKTTKEWYLIPYGPCPPSDMKPTGDPSVRIPWEGLAPPPSTVGTGGGCPPGCHIKPATGKCHCGGM